MRQSEFDNRFKSHDRSMKIFGVFFWIFFAVVATAIFTIWGVVGYTAVKVASDPAVIGRTVGEVVRGFNEVQK